MCPYVQITYYNTNIDTGDREIFVVKIVHTKSKLLTQECYQCFIGSKFVLLGKDKNFNLKHENLIISAKISQSTGNDTTSKR